MGLAAAAILPVTAIAGALVAVTEPLGDDSVFLTVGFLAAAGIALLTLGVLIARGR